MTERWYSIFHCAYAREIERIVAGQTLNVGDHEQGIPEREFTIARVKNVVVGIDSDGIFAAVNVYDTNGETWALYSDGAICEHESDRKVGEHHLRTKPYIAEGVQS